MDQLKPFSGVYFETSIYPSVCTILVLAYFTGVGVVSHYHSALCMCTHKSRVPCTVLGQCTTEPGLA